MSVFQVVDTKLPLLVSFCHLDTTRVTREETASGEELPTSDWPVDVSFLAND